MNDFWYMPENEIVGDILGWTPSYLYFPIYINRQNLLFVALPEAADMMHNITSSINVAISIVMLLVLEKYLMEQSHLQLDFITFLHALSTNKNSIDTIYFLKIIHIDIISFMYKQT